MNIECFQMKSQSIRNQIHGNSNQWSDVLMLVRPNVSEWCCCVTNAANPTSSQKQLCASCYTNAVLTKQSLFYFCLPFSQVNLIYISHLKQLHMLPQHFS